jgi:transcriptional regulator with XRE-family HTH domain
MNDLFTSVGYRIAKNRILLNLSQEKLAELAHVSRNFIGCVERAERRPSINTLLRIAKALNISLEELFKDF